MSRRLVLPAVMLGAILIAGAARADCPDGYCDDGTTLAQRKAWWDQKQQARMAAWRQTPEARAMIIQCREDKANQNGRNLSYSDYKACENAAGSPPNDFQPVDYNSFPN